MKYNDFLIIPITTDCYYLLQTLIVYVAVLPKFLSYKSKFMYMEISLDKMPAKVTINLNYNFTDN